MPFLIPNPELSSVIWSFIAMVIEKLSGVRNIGPSVTGAP